MEITALISLIVLIVSLIAFYKSGRFRREDKYVRANKQKTEILRNIAELHVLHDQILPLYSDKVINAIENKGLEMDMERRWGVKPGELAAIAELYRQEVSETEELESILMQADDQSLDLVLLRKIRNRVNGMLRHSRGILKTIPPQFRAITEGKN